MTTAPQLTYPGLLLAVFANQICLPIPAIFFLMAAGALSAHGHMRASISVLLGTFGCLAADGIWFWFGRKWGSGVMRLLCRLSADPRRFSQQAHARFRRYGLSVLCVAKFVPGLDGVMPPLFGAEGASVPGFLAFDAVGSALWCGAYVVIGYMLADQLDLAFRWTQHFGLAMTFAIATPIALYAGWRGFTLVRMIRHLRLRRISPTMLDRKLKSKKEVAVLDLLDFEDEPGTDGSPAVPGAIRIDPARLRNHPQVVIPDDVDIILYSSSGGDLVSALAATALRRIGVRNVWVLEGGLKAWREQGFPVSKSLELPEVAAARLGIKLPAPQLI